MTVSELTRLLAQLPANATVRIVTTGFDGAARWDRAAQVTSATSDQLSPEEGTEFVFINGERAVLTNTVEVDDRPSRPDRAVGH